MKAIFLDKNCVTVHEMDLVESPDYYEIPEMGESRAVVPGKAMMMAKLILRVYKLLGVHDGKFVYQEIPKKQIYEILRKKQNVSI